MTFLHQDLPSTQSRKGNDIVLKPGLTVELLKRQTFSDFHYGFRRGKSTEIASPRMPLKSAKHGKKIAPKASLSNSATCYYFCHMCHRKEQKGIEHLYSNNVYLELEKFHFQTDSLSPFKLALYRDYHSHAAHKV